MDKGRLRQFMLSYSAMIFSTGDVMILAPFADNMKRHAQSSGSCSIQVIGT